MTSNTALPRAHVWRSLALSLLVFLVALLGACDTEQGTQGRGDREDAVSGAANWCEVKALLDARCVECHDGEGSAGTPMGLTGYADTQADAPLSRDKKVFEAIAARVHDRARPMPPAGDLSAEQLALVDAWIAAGAPASDDPECSAQTAAISARVPEAVWPPPEGCDALYTITAHGASADQPYMVPPGVEVHPQVVVDAPWGDEPVQAIAFHPLTDNKRVLHHWILYANNGSSAFLTGWAPGDEARSSLPPDVGMELPSGRASLRLDLHYNSLSLSEPEADGSGVEVCVVKGEHLRKNVAAVTMALTAIRFPLVPANVTRHESTGVCNVTGSSKVHLLSAGPHSHTYAIGHRFTVKKASGEEIVMLDRPFVFGEQKSYDLEPEVVLEAGDTVTTTCIYANPTSRNINFGENTGDEMCFNFAAYWPKGALVCGLGAGGFLGGLFGGN